jgi:alpha-galactosidase
VQRTCRHIVLAAALVFAWAVLAGAWVASVSAAEAVWLDELDLARVQQSWGAAQARMSVDGNAIRIGGRTFERGVGTHARSRAVVETRDATRFLAWVGVDDEVLGRAASVEFTIGGDGRTVWTSGPMRAGDAARAVDVDLAGVRRLVLVVTDGGDGIADDHANWADARLVVVGEPPVIVTPPPAEQAGLLTPPAPAEPRINGARVFGVRPGRPLLFTIAATGERPMTFSAEGLPPGVTLNAATGRLTGRVDAAGEHAVTLIARNARGEDRKALRLVVGERIALTPPMGWNSWNCWAESVDDAKVRAAARAMAESGLVNHGWTYINIDDGWQAWRGPPAYALRPKDRFPDMAALAEYVHGLGLKLGVYSTPWKTSYAGYPGGSADTDDGRVLVKAHEVGPVRLEEADARQWAAWGVDYLKYDWKPIDVASAGRMARALERCGRDVVFSLSNSAPFDGAAEWARLANAWRTTADMTDDWLSVSGIGFDQDRWAPFAGPGRWNDPDMLVVGHVGWGPSLHPSRLTPNEQYMHVSLWCLLAAPLLVGCDLERLDAFTLNLLANAEVLAVNQDPLGRQARLVRRDGDVEVWARPLADGSTAVGLFNRDDFEPRDVTVRWADLGIEGPHSVRDLWRQADVGVFDGEFRARVLVHGVALVRVAAVSQPLAPPLAPP